MSEEKETFYLDPDGYIQYLLSSGREKKEDDSDYHYRAEVGVTPFDGSRESQNEEILSKRITKDKSKRKTAKHMIKKILDEQKKERQRNESQTQQDLLEEEHHPPSDKSQFEEENPHHDDAEEEKHNEEVERTIPIDTSSRQQEPFEENVIEKYPLQMSASQKMDPIEHGNVPFIYASSRQGDEPIAESTLLIDVSSQQHEKSVLPRDMSSTLEKDEPIVDIIDSRSPKPMGSLAIKHRRLMRFVSQRKGKKDPQKEINIPIIDISYHVEKAAKQEMETSERTLISGKDSTILKKRIQKDLDYRKPGKRRKAHRNVKYHQRSAKETTSLNSINEEVQPEIRVVHDVEKNNSDEEGRPIQIEGDFFRRGDEQYGDELNLTLNSDIHEGKEDLVDLVRDLVNQSQLLKDVASKEDKTQDMSNIRSQRSLITDLVEAIEFVVNGRSLQDLKEKSLIQPDQPIFDPLILEKSQFIPPYHSTQNTVTPNRKPVETLTPTRLTPDKIAHEPKKRTAFQFRPMSMNKERMIGNFQDILMSKHGSLPKFHEEDKKGTMMVEDIEEDKEGGSSMVTTPHVLKSLSISHTQLIDQLMRGSSTQPGEQFYSIASLILDTIPTIVPNKLKTTFQTSDFRVLLMDSLSIGNQKNYTKEQRLRAIVLSQTMANLFLERIKTSLRKVKYKQKVRINHSLPVSPAIFIDLFEELFYGSRKVEFLEGSVQVHHDGFLKSMTPNEFIYFMGKGKDKGMGIMALKCAVEANISLLAGSQQDDQFVKTSLHYNSIYMSDEHAVANQKITKSHISTFNRVLSVGNSSKHEFDLEKRTLYQPNEAKAIYRAMFQVGTGAVRNGFLLKPSICVQGLNPMYDNFEMTLDWDFLEGSMNQLQLYSISTYLHSLVHKALDYELSDIINHMKENLAFHELKNVLQELNLSRYCGHELKL